MHLFFCATLAKPKAKPKASRVTEPTKLLSYSIMQSANSRFVSNIVPLTLQTSISGQGVQQVVQKNITALESSVSSIQISITSLQSAISSLQKTVASLQTRITAIETKLG